MHNSLRDDSFMCLYFFSKEGVVQANECTLSCHDLQKVECMKRNCTTVMLTHHGKHVHASECNGMYIHSYVGDTRIDVASDHDVQA